MAIKPAQASGFEALSHGQSTKTRPWVWVALLVTFGLVGWQWQQDQQDVHAEPKPQVSAPRSIKKGNHTSTAVIAQTDPVSERPSMVAALSTKVGAQDMPEPQAQSPQSAQAHPMMTDLHRPPLSTAKPTRKRQHATLQSSTKQPQTLLFAAHAWEPPPVKPAPTPPPQAPALPYQYVGSMQDLPEGDIVILMQQNRMLMPKVGTQVDSVWRLEREDAQTIYFTYLPLKSPVMLRKSKTASLAVQRPVDTFNTIPEEIPAP